MQTIKTELRSNSKYQSGTSLLEVLISIVVLAIGLLGTAHLQATGLLSNQRAYQRSQATILAYDIADRMRANVPGASSYLATTTSLLEADAQAGCVTTDSCTHAQMAENDLYEWKTALAQSLEGATGAVAVTGDLYTVTVVWDDNTDGATDDKDPSFTVSFQL